MDGLDDGATTDQMCEYQAVHALDGRRVRWSVEVGDEVDVGTVMARCTLPSMSPGLEGASAPGLEIRSDHKGTLVQRLLQEGELIAENGSRRGKYVAPCSALAPCCCHLTQQYAPPGAGPVG